MPAVVELSKDRIVKVAVKMVNESGWDSVNARSLAACLGVSTKPLYRIYESMDEIKEDIYKEISRQYDEILTSRIDNLKWKSIENVLDEKWNQGTIINLVNKHGYSFEEAKTLFMNMWLYANGLATLIATNDITMDDQEVLIRLVKYYKILVKGE